MGYWRAAAKFAWRDLQLARARPAFLIAAIAVSVASIGGVRSAANVARSALGRESRAWLAGDLAVTTGEPLDDTQTDALDRLRARGIPSTIVITALTMGASGQSPDPSLLAVKAVDPASYPFYGAITLEPAQPLAAALQPDTTVLSKDALDRFHLHLGDSLRIGGTSFRVSAAIAAEPDRFSGVTALGVRCLLSPAAFARSGIARSGDSLRLRILFRLPPGADWLAIRTQLSEIFPEADLSDYRDANHAAVSILETTALFLNLTALLALALGAIGIAMAVRQHIEERAFTLAVMKTIGGQNRHVAGMFLLQIAWLAAIGLAAGLPLGWGIRASLLSLAGRYVVLPRTTLPDRAAILDTAAAVVAALAPTLVATALAIARLRPAILLRRDFEPPQPRGSRTIFGLAWGIPFAVLGGITVRLLGSWNLAAILATSLGAAVALAFLLVQAVLAFVRRFTHMNALHRTPFLRHGIANLCRPGNRGRALIVSLAIGLMMMAATFQLNRAVTHAIVEALPFDRPDLLVPVIEAGRLAEVRTFLERQPGVEHVEIEAQARGRLVTLDGAHVASVLACAPGPPGRLTAAEDVARRFRLRLGSRLRFTARGRVIPATVSAIRRLSQVEEIWHGTQMDCSALDPASLFYHAAVRIRPDRIAVVRRAFLDEYPALPVGTAADLSESIGQMFHDALLLARLVAWYALASSLAVLTAIVSASRGLRLREIAILSALGGRRRALIRIYSVEFAAMGLVAGAVGSLLAFGFTAVMVSAVLRGLYPSIEWQSSAVAILGAGALTVAAGWLPAYRLLRRKPLEVLRGE